MSIHRPIYDSIRPFLMSVFVHLLVIVALLFYQTPAPIVPVGIETTLVSGDELAQIEGLIRENAQLAKSGKQAQTNKPAQISDAMQAYNKELAQKEAEYQRQMAEFAKSLDAQAQAEIEAHADYLEQTQKLSEQELARLRQSAQSEDKRTAQNQKELDKARSMRDDRIAQENDKLRQSSGSASTMSADNTSTTSNTANSSSGRSANNQNASNSSAGIAAALIAHITPYWQVPTGKSGKRASAKIRVDENGNVLSVSVTSDDPTLKSSLESAIYDASPLTPVVGTNHRNLSPVFIAD